MIRVLVADDEPLVVAGIGAVLGAAEDVEVTAVAQDGRTAVEQAIRHRVDVAVLDIGMPRLDGLAALAELRRRTPDVRVLMLTAFGDAPNVRDALDGGAAGFVLKNCAPDELVRAVRAVHAGEAFLSPAVTRLVLGLLGPQRAGRRRAAERLSALSAREVQVASLVAEGLSNAEIGARLHMSETTIKTYMSRILAKLGCANRVQVALLVRDAGAGS
ncbi:DNA-binding response regulator, NarL/FixJ family, contains REC and HTH domains [Thermomonospora echinospora]|uniref:DNA-binding response regulator, NarL/FixJ family, contains REC and HTH domains n=1 Tax=Thermomonospora echinospora TaxID=1992 RepID=A0A1H5SGG6_9ACTN|nr:response regulator transcription factor [Thermomonospora echinospora]SEF49699.1 DNA-binding response regulator, NarL/FixJ family, contains REC and HTH domains [Thermomonospora echinospora]